jgi:hypothetical protein
MTGSVAPAPEMEQDVRILAVDDHRPFHDALRDLIAPAPGCVWETHKS